MLFQDKVDEAEARLEVATDETRACRKRYRPVHAAAFLAPMARGARFDLSCRAAG